MPQETLTLIPKQSRERCFQSSQMRLGLIPTPILVHFTTSRESPRPDLPGDIDNPQTAPNVSPGETRPKNMAVNFIIKATK
jgi:hypothetical protein